MKPTLKIKFGFQNSGLEKGLLKQHQLLLCKSFTLKCLAQFYCCLNKVCRPVSSFQLTSNQSHYIEVAQRAILMEQNIELGVILQFFSLCHLCKIDTVSTKIVWLLFQTREMAFFLPYLSTSMFLDICFYQGTRPFSKILSTPHH